MAPISNLLRGGSSERSSFERRADPLPRERQSQIVDALHEKFEKSAFRSAPQPDVADRGAALKKLLAAPSPKEVEISPRGPGGVSLRRTVAKSKPSGEMTAGRAQALLSEATVAAMDPHRAGPAIESPEVLQQFVDETLHHVHDVKALVTALGGHIDSHDLEERVPLDSLRSLVAHADTPAPPWLQQLISEAAGRGATAIDIGKNNPAIMRGLARTGPADDWALRLHRLAPHHGGELTKEKAADLVNALRMPRIYSATPEPRSFAAVEKIAVDCVTKARFMEHAAAITAAGGEPPADVMKLIAADVALIKRTVAKQQELESRGEITNYGVPAQKAKA